MKKWSVEVAVGLFVLIGIACIGYLTIRLGKMEIIGDNYYTVSARFQSIAGLKAGSEVELAGVPVGQVEGFSLDQERWMAVVQMKIMKTTGSGWLSSNRGSIPRESGVTSSSRTSCTSPFKTAP